MKIAGFVGNHPGFLKVFSAGIRGVTSSIYSHVELVFDDGMWGSATAKGSKTNRCIHLHKKEVNEKDWIIYDLSISEERAKKARAFFEQHANIRTNYDYLGCIATAFPFAARESEDRWACSEAVMEALGVHEPWRFNPAHCMAIARSVRFG